MRRRRVGTTRVRSAPAGCRAGGPGVAALARGTLGIGCLAALCVVFWHFLVIAQARTSSADAAGSPPPRPRYRPAEAQRYQVRLRQLEQDRQRDPQEYGVLVKL